jgi:hypothetical protein
MTNHTPQKLRAVRCVATGKVTRQSSNKTKRLLKLGGYVEVFPGESEAETVSAHGRASERNWRPLWMAASFGLAVIILLVLLI